MKIAFYNPSRIIGGAEHLFFRLYTLYRQQGHTCKVVDYAEGALSQLGAAESDIIPITSVRQRFSVDCDLFILPPNMAYEALYNSNLKDSTKIVFWSLHPYNCVPILPLAFYKKLNASSFVKALIDCTFLAPQIRYARTLFKDASTRNALLFMDGENFSFAQKFIQSPLNRTFLAIPSPTITETRAPRDPEQQSVNFFWVGRLVDFKIGALNRLIVDLDAWALAQKAAVTLHVVGSGEAQGQMHSATHLKIERHGHLNNQLLHKKLANEADAVFSMGTSVLESAAIGVPSFITMPTYANLGDEHSYLPLPETKSFDLGSFSISEGLLNFDELVKGAFFNEHFGEACKHYVLAHHDLTEIAAHLLEIGQRSTLLFSDVRTGYRKRFASRYLFAALTGK